MHSFDQALTEAELSELEGYLGSEALPEGVHGPGDAGRFPRCRRGRAGADRPSEWLPLALGFLDEGDEELAFRDEREGERILQLVTRYYNSIAIVLQEVPDSYAPLFYEAAESRTRTICRSARCGQRGFSPAWRCARTNGSRWWTTRKRPS